MLVTRRSKRIKPPGETGTSNERTKKPALRKATINTTLSLNTRTRKSVHKSKEIKLEESPPHQEPFKNGSELRFESVTVKNEGNYNIISLPENTIRIKVDKDNHPYTCTKCDSGFRSKKAYDAHAPTHEIEPPVKKRPRCDLCAKEFTRSTAVKRHMRVHTGEKPFACSVCDKRIQNSSNLRKHMLTHLRVKPFRCDVCRRRFNRKDILARHLLTHSIEKPFDCWACPKRFNRRVQLSHHQRKYHPEQPVKPDEPEENCSEEGAQRLYGKHPYKCSKCNIDFSSKKDYDAHAPIHKVEIRCDVCAKKVKLTRSNKELAEGNQPYTCRKCTPRKIISCDVCLKQFRKQTLLDRHMLVHTGEKPHVCNECHKGFQQAHNLRKHMFTHLNTRSFRCEVCDKKFHREDSFARHQLTHSTEKPFKCWDCLKGFIRPHQLEQHFRRKHPEQPLIQPDLEEGDVDPFSDIPTPFFEIS